MRSGYRATDSSKTDAQLVCMYLLSDGSAVLSPNSSLTHSYLTRSLLVREQSDQTSPLDSTPLLRTATIVSTYARRSRYLGPSCSSPRSVLIAARWLSRLVLAGHGRGGTAWLSPQLWTPVAVHNPPRCPHHCPHETPSQPLFEAVWTVWTPETAPSF